MHRLIKEYREPDPDPFGAMYFIGYPEHWLVTMGPLEYRKVFVQPEQPRGYQKEQKPPRHDERGLIKKPMLESGMARRLTKQKVDYEVFDHPIHGTVMRFNSMDANIIAEVVCRMNRLVDLSEPNEHHKSTAMNNSVSWWVAHGAAVARAQEDEIKAWLVAEMPHVWPIVFRHLNRRYIRFKSEKDVIKFRLYHG